jgi:TnsA endonuclease N terminal
MAKYHQGPFKPTNPQKYVGTGIPTYRSSWELSFMQVCDKHPNIIQWASEAIQIPYQNPKDLTWHRYIPDFLILYVDAKGEKHAEIVEIKPACQAIFEHVKTKTDKATYEINQAKWDAAKKYCASKNIGFRVLTEHDLYITKKTKSPKTK